MRLKNIECQLTQGQLTRYLRGDALSDTAIEQLESHLSECDDCTEYLDELKAELMPYAQETDEEDEELAPASPEPVAVNGPRFLVDAIRFKREKLDEVVRPIATHAVIETSLEPAPSPKTYIKPLLYSIGLAAVMVGMTTIMRDPTKLFGERLDTKLPVEGAVSKKPDTLSLNTPPTTLNGTATTTNPTVSAAAANLIKPEVKPPESPKNEAPTGADTSAAKAKVSPGQMPNPSARRTPATGSTVPSSRRTRGLPKRRTLVNRQAPQKPSAPRSEIRVYDGTGNPVNN